MLRARQLQQIGSRPHRVEGVRCCGFGDAGGGLQRRLLADPAPRVANIRIHGLGCAASPVVQLICTLRNTRSGCGISAVKRPSAVVTAVRPSGLPFGLAG